MHCVTNIREDLYWLGASDRRLAKFENVFPIPRGVSYNAYLDVYKRQSLERMNDTAGVPYLDFPAARLPGNPKT